MILTTREYILDRKQLCMRREYFRRTLREKPYIVGNDQTMVIVVIYGIGRSLEFILKTPGIH